MPRLLLLFGLTALIFVAFSTAVLANRKGNRETDLSVTSSLPHRTSSRAPLSTPLHVVPGATLTKNECLQRSCANLPADAACDFLHNDAIKAQFALHLDSLQRDKRTRATVDDEALTSANTALQNEAVREGLNSTKEDIAAIAAVTEKTGAAVEVLADLVLKLQEIADLLHIPSLASIIRLERDGLTWGIRWMYVVVCLSLIAYTAVCAPRPLPRALKPQQLRDGVPVCSLQRLKAPVNNTWPTM
jgi:hypothetical protein